MCKIKFDGSRRGKKLLNSSREKHEGAYRSREGGGRGLLCGPGSEGRLGREREKEKVPR